MQPAVIVTEPKPTDADANKKQKKTTPAVRLQNDGMAPLDADHLNRVHEELEKLNIATDVINKLELQLDEARAAFREIQTSWTQRLDQMTKKLGACIEKSRPYYEAKLEERRIRDEAQKAAIRFERANSMHTVAKQQVSLTQESLNRQNAKTVDPACLEVLNHHVQRVNEAEEERLMSEDEHRRVSQQMVDVAQRIKLFEKEQGRTIKKSRVYFDARVEFTRVLEQQKALIQRLEAEVRQKKQDYNTSLRNLEKISDAIHEERQIAGLKREQGVGCESPDPPPMEMSRLDMSRIDIDFPPPPLTSVLPNKLPFDDTTVNLRDRSISDPIDPSLFDAPKASEKDGKRPVSLGSGVILLAQQLTGIGASWMADEEKRRASSKAFTFPPEDVDVRYRTAPEGVKPLPTPPLPDLCDSDSDVGSLASGRGGFTDEEQLRGMLRSHTDLINEIDESAERLKQSMHIRSVSDAERESASGESSAGF